MLGGRTGEPIARESGKAVHTLLYLRWTTSEGLLYTTWNSAQCYVEAGMGAGLGGEGTHGTLLSVTWKPGWQQGLGQKGLVDVSD